jgi:hypothetical protein
MTILTDIAAGVTWIPCPARNKKRLDKGAAMIGFSRVSKRRIPGVTVPVLVAAVALLLVSCAPSKEALRKQAAEHPTMAIAYWGKGWEARPLHERIAPAPAALTEKIGIENRLYDFPERPVAGSCVVTSFMTGNFLLI